MNKFSFAPTQIRQITAIFLVIVFSIGIGVSFLAASSPYMPIFVFVGIVGVAALLIWLNKASWALFFTLFIVLLPNGLLPASIQSLLNRGTTIFALAVWLLNVVAKRQKIIIPNSIVMMLGFILWSAVTLLWAPNTSEALTTLQVYILRLILFLLLITNQVNTRRDLNGLMYTIALTGVLIAILSIGTILIQGYTAGTRLKVLEMNENGLGIMLLVALPMILWWAYQPVKKHQIIRMALAILYFLISIGLIGLSGSRGSAISLGFTLIFFLFWRSTRPWALLGFLFIGMAAIAMPVLFTTTLERFLVVAGDTLLGGRENLWPAALQMIRENFWLGVGLGNSSFEVIPYLVRSGSNYISYTGEPLHNPILVIWADTGIIGLLLYVGVLANALIPFIRQYFKTAKKGDYRFNFYYALIFSTFVGYMTSWIKGGGMEIDFTYFLMLGFLLIPSFMKMESHKRPGVIHEY